MTSSFQKNHVGPKCEASQSSLSSESRAVISTAGAISFILSFLFSLLILQLPMAFNAVIQGLALAYTIQRVLIMKVFLCL